MDFVQILSENAGFTSEVYGGAFESVFAVLAVVALLDLIAKGFALWRAARLDKMWWFIALLIVNSAAILPIIFLLLTNKDYRKKYPKVS